MIKHITRALKSKQDLREQDRNMLVRVQDKLCEVPLGKSLVGTAKEKNVRFAYDESLSAGEATFKPCGVKVLLSPYSSFEQQVLSMSHELRHAWQDFSGLSSLKAQYLFDYIVNVRFSEADAFGVETQVAWEMDKKFPNQGYWKHHKRAYKTMCKAFEAVASDAPETLENGKALKAAFNGWFVDRIRPQYDQGAVTAVRNFWYRRNNNIRNALTLHRKRDDLAPYMSEAFLREFGAMANGENYLEGVNLYSDYYLGKLSNVMERRIERTIRKYPESDDSEIYKHLVADNVPANDT